MMIEESLEDERDTELVSIQAIFPELHVNHEEPRRATIDLQVAPSERLQVTFNPPIPQTAVYSLPAAIATPLDGQHDSQLPLIAIPPTPADTHAVEYLPSLRLELVLTSGYPNESPPLVNLSAEHDWLPPDILDQLASESAMLWKEYGCSQIVFAYVDFLQQEAERGFGLGERGLTLPHELKSTLLKYDKFTRRKTFESGTFDCGICLEPKKGSVCHKLEYCGHVFCVGCLQGFYNNAITEGDVNTVRCLVPDCGKPARGTKRKRQRTLHPRELLEIPLERDQVQRYVDMKLKKKLESDQSTIFCPRKHCQAPARSAKYAKYTTATLEDYPESDCDPSDSEESTSEAKDEKAPDEIDRLAICSSAKCAYAFCRVCLKSWHGDLIACRPPGTSLTADELASYDYIRLHTSPCPTCNSPAQKTHGCNHMICGVCSSHFCYLCSAWLPAGNPYKHYNTKGTSCYQRLWELEEGEDEGNGNLDRANGIFAGPRAIEQAQVFAEMLQREQGARDVAPPRAQNVAPLRPQNGVPPHAQAQPQVQPPVQIQQQQQHLQRPNQAQQNAGAGAGAGARVAARGRARHAVDPGLERFLALAANDEEDLWDSDELEDLIIFNA